MNTREVYKHRAQLARQLKRTGRTYAEIALILRCYKNSKEEARRLVARGNTLYGNPPEDRG